MAISKSQQKAVHKYVKANYDRMELTVPKGQKDTIKAHASAHGESVNGFIGRAISETMERDNSGTHSETAGKGLESTQGARVVSLPSETLRTVQAGTVAEKRPAPVDKVKAFEELLRVFDDVGTVDLDKARCERLGIVYFPPDTLEAAQRAAEAVGEALPDFIRRAVENQTKRDRSSLRMGINPAAGDKLEKEA